jgi:hypothetical protein
MFKSMTTMRRGTATDLVAAWARYSTLDAGLYRDRDVAP